MKWALPVYVARAALLAAGAFTFAPASAPATDTCDVIKKFETAPSAASDKPGQRRWVEYHWNFDKSPDVMWSWGCRHSGDDLSRSTCRWLQDHSSREFTMLLPLDIMACYGYKFPAHASNDWLGMLGTIRLRGSEDRILVLDMNYRDLPDGEEAMRLAVEIDGVAYASDLTPIEPMPDGQVSTLPEKP